MTRFMINICLLITVPLAILAMSYKMARVIVLYSLEVDDEQTN